MNKPIKHIKLILFTCLAFIAAQVQATPDIQHWQTQNGAKVYFVAAPELPMVDIQIVFDAASARDGDLPGLALLTTGLLEEGAGGLNADEIADRFAAVGAKFGANSHRDMSVISLRSLTDPALLDSAIDTLATIIGKPDFPENALQRERNRLLIALQGKKQSPDAIADETFYKAIYGDHPYANQPMGNEESVQKIKREHLIKHHQQYYVGRNAVVAIVGAANKKQAAALAEAVVGALPAGQAADNIADVASLKEGELIRKPFPSSQTHILVGQPTIRRGDKERFALYVGNHILGGSGLVSVLGEEIREKRGLSYSTYSYFSPMRQRGPFQMGLQTRNDQAQEALDVLKATLKSYIKTGPTEEQLVAAKKNITGGFALNLDSNRKIVENIAMIGFYQLPLDYLDTYTDKIEAVTTKQIRRAFRQHLDPDRMATVMVGGEAQ